jgi:hypothetical protein
MSVSTDATFSVADLPLDAVESSTSVLLTGDDTAALESVFYRLVATEDHECGIVLATDTDGRAVKRSLDGVRRGAGDRSAVLTRGGPSRSDGVTTVDDLADLTKIGMELSSMLATAQAEADRFRSGIFLCSTLCGEVDDLRSVYRFLNSNLLTNLRRGDGIGVAAVDLSADVDANLQSVVVGMETSFAARIDIVESDGRRATIDVSGLGRADGTHEIAL